MVSMVKKDKEGMGCKEREECHMEAVSSEQDQEPVP
jgi:hypothetical protein